MAVQVLVDGTTRTLTATTNASGDYSVTFQPLPDEAGSYSVTAADPGVANPTVQAQFEIVGMIGIARDRQCDGGARHTAYGHVYAQQSE